ncbi:MAG: protease modulator HflC, partial [Betaproteobacteria bacterium]|nr:protease modulator HflC [Betaproteobacteria bacterium]
MSRNLLSLLIGGLFALVLLLGSVYTVDQRQSAIVFQLGEVVDTVETPGLHLKLPLVQNVRLFDRRILTLDTPEPERYITS